MRAPSSTNMIFIELILSENIQGGILLLKFPFCTQMLTTHASDRQLLKLGMFFTARIKRLCVNRGLWDIRANFPLAMSKNKFIFNILNPSGNFRYHQV
jgi:hypothetical protein